MKAFWMICALCLSTTIATAQSYRALRTTTDVACVLPAAAGVTMGIIAKDHRGLLQLGLSEASTLAVNYALELSIRKQRPTGNGEHAFPSTHTAFAFAGATHLQKRYGWKLGVPALAVATGVAVGRVCAKRHDVWDVLAGAAIGTCSSLLLTKRYSNGTVMTAAPMLTPEGGQGISVNVTF